MKTLILLSLTLILFSCSNTHKDPRLKDKDVPMDFDLGEAKDGVYSNKYFGLHFSYDKSWHVQSPEEMSRMSDLGSELVYGDDEVVKASIEASKVNTAYLFCAFRYKVGETLDFNPSVISLAENISKFPQIKDGEDYLKQSKKLLARTSIYSNMDTPIEKTKIGDKKFSMMRLEGEQMGSEFQQEYYAAVQKGFCLSFIITFANEEQREQLLEVIESAKFR